MKIGKGTLIGIIGFTVVVAVIWFVVSNSVTNDGNKQEAGLNGMYVTAQTSLSNCEAKTASAANVAGAQSDAVDKILIDAVKGRYGQPGSPVVDSGKLFSAISEAYPNLTQVSATYQNVLTIVTGCRQDFTGAQNQLVDNLQQFDRWRTGSFTVRTFGGNFPNDNLIARIGDSVPPTGKSAEAKMWQVVLTSTTLKEYQNGTLDPSTLTPFGTTTTG